MSKIREGTLVRVGDHIMALSLPAYDALINALARGVEPIEIGGSVKEGATSGGSREPTPRDEVLLAAANDDGEWKIVNRNTGISVEYYSRALQRNYYGTSGSSFESREAAEAVARKNNEHNLKPLDWLMRKYVKAGLA